MVERRSQLVDCPARRRLGTEWFLDAVFPNGKIIALRGFAEQSETSECSGRYIKSTRDARTRPSDQIILPSANSNAQVCGSTVVAAALSQPATSKHVDGRRFDVQTCLAALDWSIALARGLASLVPRSLSRLGKKYPKATSSPWFALLCASVCFAPLLLFTGLFTGMAITKQPGRTNMIAEPRTGGMTWHAKSPPIERNYDNDLIAVLIELTEKVQSEHSASPAVSSGLPRILLEPRTFATVPFVDQPTNGYLD
jgi:hypothetical protein